MCATWRQRPFQQVGQIVAAQIVATATKLAAKTSYRQTFGFFFGAIARGAQRAGHRPTDAIPEALSGSVLADRGRQEPLLGDRRIEFRREQPEHTARVRDVLPWAREQRVPHGGFDRTRQRHQPAARRRDPQQRTTTIALVRRTLEPTLSLESPDDASHRAWVQPRDARDLDRGNPRRVLDDAQHEALRTRHAETGLHSFRRGLKGMFDGPKQSQEIQSRLESRLMFMMLQRKNLTIPAYPSATAPDRPGHDAGQ